MDESNINPNSTDTSVSDDLKLGIERNHQNFLKLFYMLKSGGDFKSRSSELVPSKHYFIRVRNTDFNYSNNPSYIIQSKEVPENLQQQLVCHLSIILVDCGMIILSTIREHILLQ